MPKLEDAPVLPVTKPVEVIPEVKPTPPVIVKPNAIEIDKAETIEDKIAVAIGEKVVKPKVEAAPVTTPVVDDDADKEIAEVTRNFDPKQKEAFAKKTYELRDANRKLKDLEPKAAKLTELEKQLADYQNRLTEATKPNPELEALKTKIADYEREFSVTRFEKTQKYQDEIAKPLEKAEATVRKIAKGNELNEADLVALLQYSGPDKNKKLSEAMNDLNELDKMELREAVYSVNGLYEKRQQITANAQVELAALDAERSKAAADAEVKRTSEWNAAEPTSWAKIKELVPALAPIEGNEPWNQQLAAAESFAKTKFEEFDTPSQVSILQRAGSFHLLAGVIQSQTSQIAALEADLAKYRSGAPGPEGGRPELAKQGEDVDFATAVINKVVKSGGFR